ncbi:S1 family peptidase [Streptomyces lycii]|uniref:Trypsin-like peptidase domain-containing protein n=1 Tax=Streptomyces lycii TaxID=2654337 RepID=A0ABQ7FA03_9ACTN|nr:serine protease [Streptomyces lycii]KAF4405849.1 trypsin-like peptidase domain-containing protein [Streptomyces lycii]
MSDFPGPAAPWRLRVRRSADGAVLGTGFLILPDTALTCAHVIAEEDSPAEVLIDLAAGGPHGTRGARAAAVPVAGWSGDMSRDIAVLSLPHRLPDAVPAVLATGPPPSTATPLLAFGFPRGFGAPAGGGRADEATGPGVWTRVVAEGAGFDGGLLQYTSAEPHSTPVQQGFSGGPVVDDRTGLVVAMTTHAKPGQAISYGIPAQALRDRLPPDVAERVRGGTRPPPALARVAAALNRRGPGGGRAPDFATARASLAALLSLGPEHSDIAYYAALTAFGGRRPRETAVVDVLPRLDRRFRESYEAGAATPHLRALWAVFKEDGFIGRGLGDRPPRAGELSPSADHTAPRHADEICDLVPTPESPTWQRLDRRRRP